MRATHATQTGTRTPPQSLTSPINLGDGNFNITNADANASIVLGNGNSRILETAAGATITVGNGNDRITDTAGTATITAGTGNMQIRLGGTGNKITLAGNAGTSANLSTVDAGRGNATVTAGDGNYIIEANGGANTISIGAGRGVVEVSGANNTVTSGAGAHLVVAEAHGAAITSDTITLGAGTNYVFLEGSANTVRDGAGTDIIVGSRTGNDTFVTNAAGGTDTIAGFKLTNGDKLDLSQILAGTNAAADGSNLASFVTVTAQPDARAPMATDTVLKVTTPAATATITLLHTGTLALTDLASHITA